MTDRAVTTIQAWQTSDSDGGYFRYTFNLYEYSKLQITALTSQIMVNILISNIDSFQLYWSYSLSTNNAPDQLRGVIPMKAKLINHDPI